MFPAGSSQGLVEALTSVLMVGLGYAGIAIAPWFLLLVWIFTGTALTGFVIVMTVVTVHTKRRWVNDLVGHFCCR